MALKLLRVLVLGVIAAAADADGPVTWSSQSRASLPCVVPHMERLRPRRPPPPLDVDDRPRPKIYQWKHGDVEVNSKRISSNGTLEVSRKRDGNEGVYQCTVRHNGGLVMGYPVNLKFATIDKKVWLRPEFATATIGQPFAMSCTSRSVPPATVAWMKDDREITQNERYHILSHQLLITDVQKADAGTYKCTITNNAIRSTSSAAILTVEDSTADLDPAFLKLDYEQNITSSRGTTVVLPCPIVGWPRPRLIWQLTPPGGRTSELEFTDEVLVLTNLEFDQEGLYSCSVEGNSDISKTFNVVVSETAVIQIPPTSKEAIRAGTVRFNCSATGRPAPNVTWFKDGQPLVLEGRINLRLSTDGKRTELVISGVTSDDAGVYQCFASNSVSVASAWATLNITGADAAPPSRVQCWPEGAKAVRVRWSPPAAKQVVAYTVHSTPQEAKPGTSLPGQPHIMTEELVMVERPLTPYRFQVRAYMQPTANMKSVATDLSESVVCQGQGVPIKLAKLGEDSVVVSWKQFVSNTPGVAQWILQYRTGNTSQEQNITLDGSVNNYTLAVSPNSPMEVRVLGSKTSTWLQQDLSFVPWVSTVTAGQDLDAGDELPVPQDLMLVSVRARAFTITWQEDATSERYIYMVCLRKVDGIEECKESNKNSATFDRLQPNSQYEVRVQTRLEGRALGGAFSAPYQVSTLSEGPQRFNDLSGQFVNSSTLRISWNGKPDKYTVHYSAQLKLPVEQWDSVETRSNSVLIPGIDPSEKTYVMVTGYDPLEHSKIETILPQVTDLDLKELQYEYTRSGIRVSWSGTGSRIVCYAQNITRPVEQWASVETTESTIELTDLDPSLPTYVMVTSGKKQRSQVLSIKPRPADNSTFYIGVGVGVGIGVLFLAVNTAVCIWQRRKRSRTPVRSRRRNVSAAEGNEEEGSEMKSIGGDRLANGGGSKDAGEPLLNGHVRITENPTSKTPNGKMKRVRRYDAAFDVSRYEDPDTTLETVLDADSSAATTFNLLDTSRRPEYDLSRSSRDLSANNSFSKLPDDNMNSELIRSTTFELDNSKIQPTLQPNG